MNHLDTWILRYLGTLLFLAAVSAPSAAQAPQEIRGADLSTLYRLEQQGAVFTEARIEGDPLEILRDQGMNMVRLRLWHTPEGGENGLEETLAMARRVEEAGLDLLLDFHYSDSWADPGKQTKPVAWQGLSFELLKDSVHAYTRDVIAAFKAQGTLPEMVQLGNEIIGGMLWPEGRVRDDNETQWTRFTDLLKAAHAGLQDALEPADEVEVMIHIDRGGNYGASRWFFDHIIAKEVPFDVIGQSFYPWWHGSLSDSSTNLTALAARYRKDIILAEVAYPWTLRGDDSCDEGCHNIVGLEEHVEPGYPATVDGQKAYLEDLREILNAVPGGLGRGFFYWEAAWIAWPGYPSPWENLALFDFRGDLLRTAPVLFRSMETGLTPPPASGSLLRDVSAAPNPVDSTIHIHYTLGSPAEVEVQVFDALGREIMTRTTSALKPAGQHTASFGAGALAPGTYLYRIHAGAGTTSSGSFVVVR